MDDLIDRNRLLKEIREVYEYEYPTASGAFDDFVTRIIPNIINNQPTVDAVPVVHGQWLKALGSMQPEYFGRHACSVCDHFAPNDYHGKREFLSPICPYCGAKMDEDGEHE